MEKKEFFSFFPFFFQQIKVRTCIQTLMIKYFLVPSFAVKAAGLSHLETEMFFSFFLLFMPYAALPHWMANWVDFFLRGFK